MSHMKITKNESGDGFQVVSAPHHFSKILFGGKEPVDNALNIFRAGTRPSRKLQDSKFLTTLVRYKFERVQSISKAGKPYIVNTVPLTLQVDKPIKVT